MDFKTRKKWIDDNLTHWDPLFQEQRQSILLDKGFHYHNPKSRVRKLIENSDKLPERAKVRITKNHLNYIGRRYRNYLLDKAPGAGVFPQNEKELHDQKTAELNRLVWNDIVNRHRLSSQFNDWTYQYVIPGEIAVFINWDFDKGRFLGVDQEYDATGKPIGPPVNAFTGDFVFKVIDGYNLVLDQAQRRFDDSDAAFREFIDHDKLKARYANDPDKLAKLQEAKEEIYNTFDSSTGRYDRDTSGKILVWYFFKRPCRDYPLGHYWIFTSVGDLEDADLPEGIWPIIYENWESSGDSCRGPGAFRHLKTWQMNLNRLASKALENSIVMSGDKFITQKGSTIRQAPALPGTGTSVFEYIGQKPDFVQGSAGEQFIAQSQAELNEMYAFAGLRDEEIDKMPTEAMATLFRSVSQKAKFDLTTKKYEDFVVRFCQTTLELAKLYYSDEMLAAAVGSNEIVNISEFRSSDPLRYRVKVEAQGDDANSVMGKSLQITQILQYAGQYLDRDSIGVLARNLPYLNKEPIFKEFTLKSDITNNIILALNRGEWVELYDRDPNDYIIPRLIARTLEPDFRALHPFFQEMFRLQIVQREAMEQQKLQLQSMAQAGAVPTSGDVVRVNMYEYGPDGRPHRIWLPSESIKWLKSKLEQQGIAQQILARMDPSTVANIGRANLIEQQQMAPAMMMPS